MRTHGLDDKNQPSHVALALPLSVCGCLSCSGGDSGGLRGPCQLTRSRRTAHTGAAVMSQIFLKCKKRMSV